MAEAIARHLVETGQVNGVSSKDVFFASAGTWAMDGHAFYAETIEVLKELHITIDGKSKKVSADMVRAATFVLPMTRSHLHAVDGLVSGLQGGPHPRIELILAPHEVDDPVGMGIGAYRRVAEQFLHLLPARLSEMLRV